ncbi:MAG: hypothetical protein AB8H86_30620 [Polyangiales bacterium]
MPHTFPPLSFLFFEDGQPTKAAWQALLALRTTWNGTHLSRFVREDGHLRIDLKAGVEDPEFSEFAGAVAELKRSDSIEYFKGVDSPYAGPEAMERADFILVADDVPAHGFLLNEIEAFGAPLACPACGHARRGADRPVLAPLMIDEHVLADGPQDFLGMANDTCLVSKKVADLLASHGASGYRLSAVLSPQRTPSQNHFLLSASNVLIDPCPVHTPRDEGAICATCGAVSGSLLGHVHVSDAQVQGLSFFSKHRFGHADIYMARDMFHLLKSSGVALSASAGLDTCRHEDNENGAGLRAAATPTAAKPAFECGGVRGFLSHLDDSRPRFVCGPRGGSERERTVDVVHMRQPGCSEAELDAAEQRLPEFRHLRPLYEASNGVLLYCQAGTTPATFPTLAEMHRGEAHDPSLMRLLPIDECLHAQQDMREQVRDFELPFGAADGLPFAQLTASSDLLVCHEGAIYYFSPMYNRYHDQRIGDDLDEAFTRIFSAPARFLMDTASVATFYDEQGVQYYPKRYASGNSA